MPAEIGENQGRSPTLANTLSPAPSVDGIYSPSSIFHLPIVKGQSRSRGPGFLTPLTSLRTGLRSLTVAFLANSLDRRIMLWERFAEHMGAVIPGDEEEIVGRIRI